MKITLPLHQDPRHIPHVLFQPRACFSPYTAVLEEACQHWEGNQADNQEIKYSPGMVFGVQQVQFAR